jgi:2,3-bisphosphoglycerate-independent phosphoglycerate mutase
MVIGAGRPLPYDSLLVQHQIDSGQLRSHEKLSAVCTFLAASDRALHLVGLCSDGQIHAHIDHLGELLTVAATHHVPRVWIHAITDGRDVPDGTAVSYLEQVQKLSVRAGCGRIATIIGRAYALDKTRNLTLTEQAARAIADGEGITVHTPDQAVVQASDRGDEWVAPSVVTTSNHMPLATVQDQDALLLFNFRSDRIQQLANFLVEYFSLTKRNVTMLSLTQYDTRESIPALVSRADASGGLADELAAANLRSVRVAEPEKFEHVTYYINGRSNTKHAVEEHLCIRGEKELDYRTHPQMHLGLVTNTIISAAARPEVALVVANLANIDVIGHTGDFTATVKAAEYTDVAVARIVAGAAQTDRWVLMAGDHGNAEQMARPGPNGIMQPYGGHTTNPVPAVFVPSPGQHLPRYITDGGTLADIAPTVLTMLGQPPAAAMTGRSLL